MYVCMYVLRAFSQAAPFIFFLSLQIGSKKVVSVIERTCIKGWRNGKIYHDLGAFWGRLLSPKGPKKVTIGPGGVYWVLNGPQKGFKRGSEDPKRVQKEPEGFQEKA